MHLLKSVLSGAAIAVLATSVAGQDPGYAPSAVALPPAVQTAPAIPPEPTVSPEAPGNRGDVTRIDQYCAASVPPTFDVTIEALLWRLEHTWGQAMILNPILGTETRTDALDLGMAAGPRINVAYLADQGIEDVQGFETSYFGLYNWTARRTEVAPVGTFLRLPDRFRDPGVTTDFSAAEEMRVRYDVQLNSVEVNLLLGRLQAPFSWIFGGRFIRLEEEFNLDSLTAGRTSFYHVGTRNDLWGVQWGFRWNRRRGYWTLSTMLKVGIFDNQARQNTLVTDVDRTVVLRNFSTETPIATAVVDGGFSLAYQINAFWSVRAGYNVFWMNNVARATDQLDFSDNPLSGSRLFFRQDAVAHGLNFGLERRW